MEKQPTKASPGNGRPLHLRIFSKVEPFLYLIPAFAMLILFTYYPFVKNTVLSFFTTNKYREVQRFAGFGNYIRVMGDDKFVQAIGNTLIYVITTVPISIAIGFVLALLARKRHKASTAYEAMYALSMAISASVIAMIFQLAYNPTMGIINKVTGLGTAWLTDSRTALLALIIVQIWANIGYNFIFLFSALRGISEEVLESAKIDGAIGFRLISRIIVPQISPTMLFLLVKDIAYAMTTASFTLILTYPLFGNSGGPGGSTETIMSYIYSKAIIGTNYNAAFAATMIGFVLSAVMMAASMLLEKWKVSYD